MVILFLALFITPVHSAVNIRTIDFLKSIGIKINAAGPLLVQMDSTRNRIIVAHTLSSMVSVIDGKTNQVTNIPISARAFQHLKSEAMTLNKKTGNIYLIGANCFHIVFPEKQSSITIDTKLQFESIAVDEKSGNVFLTGRESKRLGFYDFKRKKLKFLKWLDFEEKLINLNATPPPPIRKVVSDNILNKIIAVDGYTSQLYLFDGKTGKLVSSRSLNLTPGGRWHLAGYNEKTHHLYLVIETNKRRVIEAAKIDIINARDIISKLPEYTEGVGINYNPLRDEVYVPYDNFPSVHVVEFKNNGKLSEIILPAFGNDASAIDVRNEILYIASWAHGEIDVIDLKTRKLMKRVPGLGILPHTFNMAYNPWNNLLYLPKGATAVNGTFGAAISVYNPDTDEMKKIYTGWSPIDLIELKERNSFLIFNNEDQFAEVQYDGSIKFYQLPFDYPIQAILNADGDVYLSYGAHQSYWPDVYIWCAKNGILTIHQKDLSFYDRRIPRQAHKMVLDKDGALYFTQNNWGRAEQFLGTLPDPVRLFDIGKRLRLGDEVTREITPRDLKYDAARNRLYFLRIGETDQDPGALRIVNLDSQKVEKQIPVGLTPTDLIFDDQNIYVANFASNSVSVIDKERGLIREIKTDKKPLKLCRYGDSVFSINHIGNSLTRISGEVKSFKLPVSGYPDNIFNWGDRLILTTHYGQGLYVISFDPVTEKFAILLHEKYPYGNTRFDTHNVSFYVDGQFGDAVFQITSAKVDQKGRLWMTDFLSGKLFIFEDIQ